MICWTQTTQYICCWQDLTGFLAEFLEGYQPREWGPSAHSVSSYENNPAKQKSNLFAIEVYISL